MFLPLSIICELSSSAAVLHCEFCSYFNVVDTEIISAKEKEDTAVPAKAEDLGWARGNRNPLTDDQTLLIQGTCELDHLNIV